MRRTVLLWSACLTLGAVGLARAQTGEGGPDDIIAIRKAGMELQSAVAGDMKRAVAAKADPTPFKDGADALVLWSRTIPSQFPVGTENGLDTKAKPAIWSDASGFEAAAARLTDAAQKVRRAAASGDQAQFATAFQAMGQACAACHRAYQRK